MIFKLIIFCLLIFKLGFGTAVTLNELGITNETKVNISTEIKDQPSREDTLSINATKGGASNFGYYASNGVDFDGRTSGFNGGTVGLGDRACLGTSTESFADHEIVMGPKDVLEGVRVWVDDNDANDDLNVIVYESCLPTFAAGDIEITFHLIDILATNVGISSQFFLINKSYRGRHDDCKMMMRVRFGSSTSNCFQAPDVSLQKVRAQLRLNDLIFANGFE